MVAPVPRRKAVHRRMPGSSGIPPPTSSLPPSEGVSAPSPRQRATFRNGREPGIVLPTFAIPDFPAWG
ncbi:hypothetical protein SCATT_10020 [Streptantibioticus cattleyicolor NRRL 8057 = DSM 46488]|uniref:Uncharacterized protein n=1 Tax=Streptantibioticus cattleyicolor (strain ATCC 35852 / DSM 46488 / JCM 4925 / NBRC 14057 / NRRL 8057) TaxID=1003195 RepID=G8WN88_STREN|nr:hypothetical protein SCATT_10020 [Streptantibioticus cattleyicolor NRRL 8057 = DSM 46488]